MQNSALDSSDIDSPSTSAGHPDLADDDFIPNLRALIDVYFGATDPTSADISTDIDVKLSSLLSEIDDYFGFTEPTLAESSIHCTTKNQLPGNRNEDVRHGNKRKCAEDDNIQHEHTRQKRSYAADYDESDSDSSSDSTLECSRECVCNTGQSKPPKPKKRRRRRRPETPMINTLLKFRLLDTAYKENYLCCENHCCLKW